MSDFCDSQCVLYPDLSPYYSDFSVLFARKQWHQLTQSLLSFLSLGGGSSNLRDGNVNYVRLWEDFVKGFENKVNQLSLAKIAVRIATSYGDDTMGSQLVLESELPRPF